MELGADGRKTDMIGRASVDLLRQGEVFGLDLS